jgi:hypothetical protein
MLLREVHEEYCETVRGRNGQGPAGSSKIDLILFIHYKFNPFCRQIPLLPQLELHHFVRIDRDGLRPGHLRTPHKLIPSILYACCQSSPYCLALSRHSTC